MYTERPRNWFFDSFIHNDQDVEHRNSCVNLCLFSSFIWRTLISATIFNYSIIQTCLSKYSSSLAHSDTFCLFTFLSILNFVGDIHFPLHKFFTILLICNHWLSSFDIYYVSGLILFNNYVNLLFAKITP